MRLSNIREISANSLSLAMCSRHPRTVRTISFIAFRLIAGTKLVKYLPDRGLRAERGWNPYPRKSNWIEGQARRRLLSRQYAKRVFSG
jgi:hypothetical protein